MDGITTTHYESSIAILIVLLGVANAIWYIRFKEMKSNSRDLLRAQSMISDIIHASVVLENHASSYAVIAKQLSSYNKLVYKLGFPIDNLLITMYKENTIPVFTKSVVVYVSEDPSCNHWMLEAVEANGGLINSL